MLWMVIFILSLQQKTAEKNTLLYDELSGRQVLSVAFACCLNSKIEPDLTVVQVFSFYSLTSMAAHLIVFLLLFSVLKGVHSITTVSKVSVEAGKSISIPCLYESQYIDHVKYLCEGHIWSSCSYAVKTNKPDPSGKYSISDDKKEQIFTVTIKNLTNQNTDYWCVVEINNGPDCGQYFQLSVTSGTPSLYVDHQRITGYIGENITIRCHPSNSGEMKWCRLGRNCVTGSSGSIDGTTVTTHMRDPDVSTVTMTGLRSEDSGWYWCAEGDIQIPVYLNVTEKPIKIQENKEHRASYDTKILIIPLSVLVLILIMVLIWFILSHKKRKVELSAKAMTGEDVRYSEIGLKENSSPRVDKEVIYSEIKPKEKSSTKSLFAECDVELTYSSVVKKQRIKWDEGKDTEVSEH
ncbi:uncharacterized protein LOC120714753 [Simochromis diagramma]|uniref:uncharacterized protein LOC120714753 n=1 Tax=Simochromis diagramma TaxID=43689 RepID=UPI001A7EE79D|nr:uncharacterized protein LOC120714753 [Simochromis diagramma]